MNDYDESCNAYGPTPSEEDQYKPDAAAKAKWAATMARMAYDRQKEKND